MSDHFKGNQSKDNKLIHCQACDGGVPAPEKNATGRHVKWIVEILELLLGAIIGFFSALIVPMLFFAFKQPCLWDVYVIAGIGLSIYAVKLVELVIECKQQKP